jgi:hypothetical protein
MRMKCSDNQVIRQQRRIGQRKAASRAFRRPLRYKDPYREKIHIDPTTLFVPIIRVIDLRLHPCLLQRLDHGRMRQEFRSGGWPGWRSARFFLGSFPQGKKGLAGENGIL